MNSPVLILLVVFLATTAAAAGYGFVTSQGLYLKSSSDHTSGYSSVLFLHQGIVGRIQIANVTPLCTTSGQSLASGPNFVMTSTNGQILVIPLTWYRVNQCALVSQFHVDLQPGAYSLTVSPCNYLGCKTLPITVNVQPGVIVPVNVSINTGIY